MKIVYGPSGSGKSMAAAMFAANSYSIYVLSECDGRLMNRLGSSNIEFFLHKSAAIEDIRSLCLEKGGSMANSLECCVVDSMNAMSKIDYPSTIRGLLKIERDFGLEIVTTFNTLSSKKKGVDSALLDMIRSDFRGSGIRMISSITQKGA